MGGLEIRLSRTPGASAIARHPPVPKCFPRACDGGVVHSRSSINTYGMSDSKETGEREWQLLVLTNMPELLSLPATAPPGPPVVPLPQAPTPPFQTHRGALGGPAGSEWKLQPTASRDKKGGFGFPQCRVNGKGMAVLGGTISHLSWSQTQDKLIGQLNFLPDRNY